MNRGAAGDHANAYWYRPCEDRLVWLDSRPISIVQELTRRGLSPEQWQARFLNYDAARYFDGLYFVRASVADLGNLSARQFFAPNFAPDDVILVQDWAGLNDCTHFVSECLARGGVRVGSLLVGDLVTKLRARSDTKTLGYFVPLSEAQRIVDSGAMDLADIIAFGTQERNFTHGHATIFMGNDKVANHTHLNHPAFTGGLSGTFGNVGGGRWQFYADPRTGHPLVILIHFADSNDTGTSSMRGWWEMTWRSSRYYYYFERNGRALWTRRRPTSLVQGPLSPEGNGYWFEKNSKFTICWTTSGSLESYPLNPGNRPLRGQWNGSEPITGTKMNP
ncbi:MAG TPA: hypothetical protein VGY54_16750 [Polyangiaceae bacterium]|nr:hypothetical protein [Polyangiaceae bacterium]